MQVEWLRYASLMALVSSLLLLASAQVSAAADPLPSEIHNFKDWVITCDNTLRCEATSLVPELNAEEQEEASRVVGTPAEATRRDPWERFGALNLQRRHAGLSQFIVNLRGPGVEIRPIVSMNGAHHFNEVILDGAFVPDEMVFGTIGQGWQQVTSELSFERSGPERFLSTFVLLDVCAEHTAAQRVPRSEDLGRLVARIAGLHQMSSAVAGALQRHEPADVPAAVVKVLGTTTEGDIAEFAHLALDSAVDGEFSTMATAAVDQRPGFTLRGGTNEVLRGVIARGLGIR